MTDLSGALDYRSVLDGFADAVVAANGAGCIVYANRAAETLLDWPTGALVGEPLTAIQPVRFQDAHRAGLARYLATGVPTLIGGRARFPARRRDGSEVDVELALSAFRLGDGSELFVAALRDLRERVELERQIEVTGVLRAAGAAATKLAVAPDEDTLLGTVVSTLADEFDAALARVWLHDPATATLRLRASAGLSTATADSSRATIDVATSPSKVAEVARTHRPVVHNGLAGDTRFDQAWVAREGIVAVASFPLLAGSELLGVLVHFARRPLPDEIVEALANFAAIVAASLGRDRLLDRERTAHAAAEAARDRASLLAEAAAVLAAALDEPAALVALGRLLVPAVANRAVFDMTGAVSAVRRIVVGPTGPGAAPAMSLVSDDDAPNEPSAAELDAGDVAQPRPTVTDSRLVVPIVARGATLGALTLTRDDAGRRYGPDDLTLVQELARRAGLAVDNVRLVHDARRAEERARRQALHLDALAEAGQAFAAASLDPSDVLDVIARRTVEAIGDGCIIRLVSEDGARFEPAAAHHPSLDAQAMLWDILTTTDYPIGDGLVGRVATSGSPVLLPSVDPAELRDMLKPEFRPFLDRFGIHGVLAVPLRARGHTIGTLMTWRDHPGTPYTSDDLALAQGLADRAAVAIENARLYREQVAATDRIRLLAAERAAVLGQIADGVIIADPDGRIAFVNDAASRLHGVERLGVAVDNYTEAYHLLTLDGDPYPSTDLPLARAVQRGETVVNALWRIRRPDGTEIVAQGSASPVVGDNGERLGAVVTMRDVTAEFELDRQKDDFVAAASHDLKTPLTAIKGWAQLLHQRADRDPTRDGDRRALRAIETQANVLDRLIEELLAASHLRGNEPIALALTAFDLVDFAERLVAQTRALAAGHRVRLIAPDPVPGRWDEAKLEQIVGNLIANAIKYSPDGGEIEVGVTLATDEARLTVRDQGLGIPATALPRVFDRYFRVERTGPAGAIHGLGLGLFSAQRLATRHGGRIEVASDHGRGSAFTLILPLVTSDEP